jgi:hypothetical protein
MIANSELYQKRFSELVARTWDDEAFAAKLRSNPRAAVAEFDLPLPKDAEIRVFENTDKVAHVVLPTEAAEKENMKEAAKHPGGQQMLEAFPKVVARAHSDAGFRSKLLSNPTATLAAAGIAFPKDTSVRVVENSDKVFNFVIPAKPSEILTEEQLEMVSGGDMSYCAATFLCLGTIPSTVMCAGTAGSASSS